MTTPNGPSAYEPNKYYIPSNLPSDAAGGMAEFASTDQTGWEKYIHDRENAKWKPTGTEIGQPLDLLNNLIQAVVSVFQGDVGPLEDLVDGVIRGIPIIGDIYSAITSAITGVTNPSGGGGILGFLGNFFSGFTKAAAGQNPGSGEGITSAISGIFNQQAAVANSASTAASAAAKARDDLATGANGRIVSQGVMDGLTFQMQSFTSNGTFTPPTPPAGKVISHFVVTAYSGGDSGDCPGLAVSAASRGGRGGRRVSRRVSVAEMGSSQPITVGAGGAPKTTDGPGNAGSPSSIGSLLSSDSSPGTPTPFGALASAGDPGEGGRGGMKITKNGGVPTYDFTEGQRGEDGGGLGGNGGYPASGWLGTARDPQPGEPGAVVGDFTTGGGGGGGGGAGSMNAQAGAAGGAPAGGGGAAGAANNASYIPGSGPGGRGQVDITTYTKDAP